MKNQKGFTLIEIAIVLVIIGLLLGGVLKGQELITSAKIKSLANDMKATQTMVLAYQDRYKTLPGDDPGAAARFPAAGADPVASAGNGNGVIDGGKFDDSGTSEAKIFWQHVRRAGLAVGAATTPAVSAATYLPAHGFGGVIGINSTANVNGLPGVTSVCANNVAGKYNLLFDQSFDDGNTDSGSLRTRANINTDTAVNTNVDAAASADIVAATNYTVCYGF